jgi:S1-C subfamily serine protease
LTLLGQKGIFSKKEKTMHYTKKRLDRDNKQGVGLIFFIPLLLFFNAFIVSAEKRTFCSDCSYEWKDATNLIHNTVVQIIADRTSFDWLNPWRLKDQGQSSGSGFFFKLPGILEHEGYILTNYHVIDEARVVAIYIPILGKKMLSVELVGACPEADIALLKLTEESLLVLQKIIGSIPHLCLGDSEELEGAMPVMALGYPLGSRYIKSTVGVIAGREYDGDSYIHMTAPINPGNSGGPLVNIKSNVMGINTAHRPDSSNIGYIIPINDIKKIIPELLKKKLVRKPSWGIVAQQATNEQLALYNNPIPGGMYIYDIKKNSFSEKIGILKGDVLYSVNGHSIDNYCDVSVGWKLAEKVSVQEFFMHLSVEDELHLVLYRQGKRIELSCILTDPPLYPVRKIYPHFEPLEVEYAALGGIVLMQLRKNHFEEIEINQMLYPYTEPDYELQGVLVVTSLFPGSALQKVDCLYVGALIDTVNNKKIHSLEDFHKALEVSLKTGIVSFVTKEGRMTAVSLESIVSQEEQLAQDFMYPISTEIATLIKSYTPIG